MLKLIRYMQPYALLMALVVLLLFGQATCDLALPDYMADMVNEGIATGDSGYIVSVGVKMLGISVVGAAFSITVGLIGSRIAAGLGRSLRSDVFKKVAAFSNAEYDKFTTSSLITRTTNDVTQIQNLMVMMIRMVFYAPILGIGGFIHALNTDKNMSWIILVALLCLFGIVIFMMLVAMPKFRIIQTLVDKLNQVVRENLDGMLVIRAFNTQRFEEKRFDKANQDLTDTNLFIGRLMAGMMPAMMLLMNLTQVLVVWVGAHQVSSFHMGVGDMMAYMQYVMQIIMAFLMMSMMFIMIPRASVSAGRIADVLNEEPSITNGADLVEDVGPIRGLLEFRDVDFSYPDAEEKILHGISFTARPGETTAFIGSTGCGKSTIVNLIPRFYDVTGGEILLDGVDIRNLPLETLRGALGFVPQKAILFSGSIYSNLTYADKDATEEEAQKAAEIAQAMDFIRAKPEGMDTSIAQGGSNVSGGQKQRLSIARALLKKPPIYIFDDSFSALDFKTDAALRAALKRETGESTVLLVTQRISTAMTAEQIIVLDKGTIVDVGTHEELMKKSEVYQEIAYSQLSREDLA